MPKWEKKFTEADDVNYGNEFEENDHLLLDSVNQLFNNVFALEEQKVEQEDYDEEITAIKKSLKTKVAQEDYDEEMNIVLDRIDDINKEIKTEQFATHTCNDEVCPTGDGVVSVIDSEAVINSLKGNSVVNLALVNNYSNSGTDSRTHFNLFVYIGTRIITSKDIDTVGHQKITFTADTNGYFGIKHNGATTDLWIEGNTSGSYLIQGKTYTLSFDVLSVNPSVVNGLKLANIMLVEGSEEKPYTPYGITNSTVSAIKSVGRNLFDINKAVTGYIRPNGTIEAITDWKVSDYISVNPNESYTLSLIIGLNDIYVNACYYDINKNYISGATLSSNNEVGAKDTKTFVIPNNCYYLRIGYRAKDTQVMLNKGSTAQQYEPYVYDYLVLSGNLFDLSTSEKGKYMSNTGAVGNAETSYLSDYIKVEPNTVYSQNTKQGCFLNFYDKSKTRLGGAISGNVNFTTPNNCYYIRITMDNGTLGDTTDFMLNVGKEALPYSPFGAIKQKVKRYVYEVSLDDLNFSGASDNGFYIKLNDIKKSTINLLSSNYTTVSKTTVDSLNVNEIACDNVGYLICKTSGGTPTGTLVYELSTPIEEDYDGVLRGIGNVRDVLIPSPNTIRVWNGGIIQQITGSIPAYRETKYAVNIKGQVVMNTNAIEELEKIINKEEIVKYYNHRIYMEGSGQYRNLAQGTTASFTYRLWLSYLSTKNVKFANLKSFYEYVMEDLSEEDNDFDYLPATGKVVKNNIAIPIQTLFISKNFSYPVIDIMTFDKGESEGYETSFVETTSFRDFVRLVK